MYLEQMGKFMVAVKTSNFETLNAFILDHEPVHCVLGSSQNDHLRTTITTNLETTSNHYYDVKELLDSSSNSNPTKNNIQFTEVKEGIHIRDLIVQPGIYYQRLYEGNNYISTYEKWQLDNHMVPDRDYQQLSTEHLGYVEREKEVEFRLIIALNGVSKDDFIPFQFYFYKRNEKWYLSGIYHPLVN